MNRKNKKILIVSIISFIVVLFTIIILFAVTFPFFTLVVFNFTPPIPEIIHGEFPFMVEYELNGERFVIEDTFIAEFNGFNSRISTEGRRRLWKGELASRGRDVFITNGGIELLNNYIFIPIDEYRRLSIFIGFAHFYMGDVTISSPPPNIPQFTLTTFNSEISEPSLAMYHSWEIRERYSTTFSSQDFTSSLYELYEETGIKIINYKLSEPIVNTFN